MSKKVLLVKIDRPAGGAQRISASEPIGLCYLSAYLKAHGCHCRILHLFTSDFLGGLTTALQEDSYDLIGFSVRNFNFSMTQECITLVRELNLPAVISIGGECITSENAIEITRKLDADLAVINDGEASVLKYLQGIAPEEISGVCYRTATGGFLLSMHPPERFDPAQLPMMDRTGLPMEAYVAEAFPGKKYATMHVQRGCRYKCTFCHTACRYDGPISRTVDQVLEEIDHLTIHYGIEALAIWDEDFFSDLDRVQAIAEGLISRGNPVDWHTFMKLTDLKNPRLQAMLPLLRESGYVRAIVGLESFLPKTLKKYHKAGGPHIEESLQPLTNNRIKLTPAYIIGEPDESEADIRYGLTHLLKLRDRGINIDLPYIAFITPFAGTLLYQEYLQKGLIVDDNLDHYDGEHVVVKSKCPPDVLMKLRDEFYRDFYGGENGRQVSST